MPVGMVLPHAGPIHEAQRSELGRLGWLVCDGQLVSVAQYPALFRVIGFTYGKQDDGHFYLPDYRGLFLRGVNGDARLEPDNPNSPLRDPDAGTRKPPRTGGLGGNQVGSVQEDAFQSHEHDYKPNAQSMSVQSGGGLAGAPPSLEVPTSRIVPEPGGTAVRHGPETRPRNIYVHYLIHAG